MLMPDALRHATQILTQAGIDSPAREARLIIAHAAATPANHLPPVTTQIDPTRLHALLSRRAAREPLAYITGTRGFWSIDLAVSPATLIPRPDSETLIEATLAHFPDRTRPLRILDLGTGTGALLLAALTEYPNATGLGTDRTTAATTLAAHNARRLALSPRAAFLTANWTDPLSPSARFDLILCNPPYIPTADIPALMPEVARYEPATALDGGPQGLAAYTTLIPKLPALLSPGGLACLELGAGQLPATTALAQAAGFTHIATRQDLAGHPRALLLTTPETPPPEKTFGTGPA